MIAALPPLQAVLLLEVTATAILVRFLHTKVHQLAALLLGLRLRFSLERLSSTGNTNGQPQLGLEPAFRLPMHRLMGAFPRHTSNLSLTTGCHPTRRTLTTTMAERFQLMPASRQLLHILPLEDHRLTSKLRLSTATMEEEIVSIAGNHRQ